jgi:methylated-DNA-[protein]-cysteine S-methyltransferase
VLQVFLPGDRDRVEGQVRANFTGAHRETCALISDLCGRLQRFLEGEAVGFELSILARERCYRFQKWVLLAEYKVPRGWVTTYGRIAGQLGVPGGARAVGNALAGNPFPIIIPCHRAVRWNGDMGGFQGGRDMKRALLEMEGVEFTASGKVVMERVWF